VVRPCTGRARAVRLQLPLDYKAESPWGPDGSVPQLLKLWDQRYFQNFIWVPSELRSWWCSGPPDRLGRGAISSTPTLSPTLERWLRPGTCWWSTRRRRLSVTSCRPFDVSSHSHVAVYNSIMWNYTPEGRGHCTPSVIVNRESCRSTCCTPGQRSEVIPGNWLPPLWQITMSRSDIREDYWNCSVPIAQWYANIRTVQFGGAQLFRFRMNCLS